MKQRPRRYITDSEMAVIWDRIATRTESSTGPAPELFRGHTTLNDR